jgi:hypothetical protein
VIHGHDTGPLAVLEALPLAVAMRQELWLYPAVEIVHIAGFVVLVGSVAMLDIRLLGISRGLSVRQLARHLLPWTWSALLLIVPTGLLMFMAHADDMITNPAFQVKLLLILCAAVNAAMFHTGVYRGVMHWDAGSPVPNAAKLHAVASLALWLGVIACGRLLAYL